MTEKYPIVTDVVPSQNTAMILRNLLFSPDGILTSHLSFMYQSWLNSVNDKAFGNYLKQVAENDGAILDALGNLTVAFGGDPNFRTTGRNWSTQYLLLQRNRNQFLKSAMQHQLKSIAEFDNAIGKVENESLKKLLTTIRDDKRNIVRDLNSFLQTK